MDTTGLLHTSEVSGGRGLNRLSDDLAVGQGIRVRLIGEDHDLPLLSALEVGTQPAIGPVRTSEPRGRLTRKLIQRIRRCPARAQVDPVLSTFLHLRMADDLRAVLEAWARHEVDEVTLGNFHMSDRLRYQSFRLPAWEEDRFSKEVFVIKDEYDDNFLILGERHRQRVPCYLAFEYSCFSKKVRPEPVFIQGEDYSKGYERSLEDFLAQNLR